MLPLAYKKISYIFLLVLLSSVQVKHAYAEGSEEIKQEDEASVCEQLKGESDGWLDEAHTFLSIQFCEPSVWFDSFFSDERIDEEVRAGTRVRWQNDFILTEGGDWSYVSDFHASFKLPKAKKNISLIFEDDEEDALKDVVPGNEENRSNLGLLYEVTRSERANVSVRVKLSPSITFRYRYKWPVTDTFSARFTQELSRRDNADGTVSRIDFEKILHDDFLLRQSNSVAHSETYDGKELENSLVLYQHLTDKSAVSYESSISGVTKPDRYTKNTRVGIRFRQNFYRKWLFYEIAPAVNWNKSLVTDERLGAWEVLFRLEVNFVNL